MMCTFKIVPLPAEVAEKIRRMRKDDFGNEVIQEIARGLGPCRLSLKGFKPGIDHRLLFSYSPFDTKGPYNQNGPIFIFTEEVKPYSDIYRFPPEIKADIVHFPLTLIGYNKDHLMTFAQLVGTHDIDELIEKIFSDHPKVEYLHARNAEAGCFICKIERV